MVQPQVQADKARGIHRTAPATLKNPAIPPNQENQRPRRSTTTPHSRLLELLSTRPIHTSLLRLTSMPSRQTRLHTRTSLSRLNNIRKRRHRIHAETCHDRTVKVKATPGRPNEMQTSWKSDQTACSQTKNPRANRQSRNPSLTASPLATNNRKAWEIA